MCTMRPAAALACLAFIALGCSAENATGPGADLRRFASVGSEPSPLVAAPLTDTKMTVSWVDHSPNEAGFEIHRSATPTGVFTLDATTAAKVTSYADGGLTPTTDYCYKVRAFRTNGGRATYSSFSNVACAKTYGPPESPHNVAAVPNEQERVILSWGAADGATGYSLERAAASAGPWIGIIVVHGAGRYVDSQRAAEQQVCYRVSATNSWGVTAATPACTVPPAMPTNPAVSAPLAGGLDVTWTDVSGFEDGYEVQRATADLTFAPIAFVARNTTLYHDTAATLDIRYWYRVRAMKDAGYTDFSGWVDGVDASAVPNAPVDVSVTTVGSSAVDLRWTEPSANGAGFRIERTANGGGWTTVASVPWTQTEFSDNPVAGDGQYCYRVIAFNGKGDSQASASDCAQPLKAPTDLVATSAGSSAVNLSWTDASAFESGYEIDQIECYGGSDYKSSCYVMATWVVAAGSTSYQVTGLAAGSAYTFAVYAMGTKNGNPYYSDGSNEVSVHTDP